MEAEISANLDIATSMAELELKVNALPSDEDITVQLNGNLLYLRWGRNSKIVCEILAETAPLIEIPKTVETIVWKPGVLQAYARTLPAFAAKTGSSNGNNNPVITGVHFSKEKDTGETYVRATNQYRAVTVKSPMTEWFEGVSFSIPTESLQGLADILSADGEVTIGMNEAKTLLVFKSGLTTAVTRVLVGVFPDIDNGYADYSANTKWIFDRMELIDLCKRARQLSQSRPALTIRSENSKVTAELDSVLTQQIGAVAEGEVFNFKVDAEYIELAASLFRTEEVQILFKNESSPLTIVCEETDHIKALIGQIKK